jgi:DNA invertase Pin-like site-specific DNA recombinase
MTTASHPAKIAAYLRISTDGQEAGHGLDVQRQHIAAYAATQGISVDLWLQDIESGAKEDREGLSELREAVRAGEVGTVLVYRLDRLARDSYLAEGLYREFSKTAKVVSVSESFGEGFTGNLMRQIVQAFAEYERAVIAARLKGGRKASARKQGTFSGGAGVMGYRPKGSKADPGKGALVVIESEAEAIRQVFRLKAEGLTLQKIADELNRQGFQTMKGAAFSPTHVHRILGREEFYKGAGVLVRSYEAEAGAHSPIL